MYQTEHCWPVYKPVARRYTGKENFSSELEKKQQQKL
jgi:cytochrome c551/c552